MTTLQQQLNAAGAAVATDGVFGPGTRQAVIAFQQGAGLSPDGIVGPRTWAALASAAPAAVGSAAAVTDPRQAAVIAKHGQVRVALKSLNAKSGGSPVGKPGGGTGGGERAAIAAIEGWPIPICGIRLPSAAGGPVAVGHVHGAVEPAGGAIQRSWLDDAESWLDQKTDAAGEWVDEQVGAASQAVDDAAEWAENQVSAAGQWVDDAASGPSAFVQEEFN